MIFRLLHKTVGSDPKRIIGIELAPHGGRISNYLYDAFFRTKSRFIGSLGDWCSNPVNHLRIPFKGCEQFEFGSY